MAVDHHPTEHVLAEHTQRLTQEFGEALGTDLVFRRFREVLDSFADAPVQTYVPIIAFRLTRESLAEIRAAQEPVVSVR